MTRTRITLSALVVSVAGAGLMAGCDGFSFTFTFIVPRTASAEATQTVTLPAGANVVVTNDNGSTRVTVDPAATQATIEITRTALAREQEDADALLPAIVVTVTEPTMEANTLTISAPRPPEATANDEQFEVVISEDELSFTSIAEDALIASVRLRITLPPGHAVDVTQGYGNVRAVTLDTASTLRTTSGGIRSIAMTGDLVTRTEFGGVIVESHNGGLNTEIGTGGLDAEFTDLDAPESIIVRTETGGISLRLPDNVDADVTAITEVGNVFIDRDDFDDTNNFSSSFDGPGEVETVTLNNGGATIDVRTETGSIEIQG